MGKLGAVLRQGFVVELARLVRIEAEVELVFPAELEARLGQRVVADLRPRVAFAQIGGMAERMVDQAMAALTRADTDQAERVIEEDVKIDNLQREVEEKSILMIAKRQPMARDLREIVAAIRILQLSLRDRLAPRWHYALWLILVVRLLMPWSLSSAVSIFNVVRLDTVPITVTPPQVTTRAT